MKFNRKAIAVLANKLVQGGKYTLSQAWKAAWTVARLDQIRLVTFVKKSGEETTRVVSTNLGQYQTFKGTGRSKSNGLRLFVDIAKVFAGAKSAIISTYQDNIVSFS